MLLRFSDCNSCAYNVRWQLESSIWSDYRDNNRIRFSGYAYPTSGYILQRINSGSYEHVQSVGRLAGIGNNEYMVFTHSTASSQSGKQGALAVVRMGANQWTSGYPFGNMPNGSGSDQNTSNRTVARTYSRNNHPGGLSVLGQACIRCAVVPAHPSLPSRYPQQPQPYGWCEQPSMATNGFSIYDVSNVGQNTIINSNPQSNSIITISSMNIGTGGPQPTLREPQGLTAPLGLRLSSSVMECTSRALAGRADVRTVSTQLRPSQDRTRSRTPVPLAIGGRTETLSPSAVPGMCIYSRWRDTEAA